MKRLSTFGPVAGTAVLLLMAGAVWACTAQPRIFSLGPQVGPVGMEIKLEGQTARNVPVEIRWNSNQGAAIGEGLSDFNGNFSVPARIPDAEPGMYFLVVTAGEAGVVRTAFQVTSEGVSDAVEELPAAAGSSDLWRGFSGSAGSVEAEGGAVATSAGSAVGAALGGAFFALGAAALVGLGFLSLRRRRISQRG